MRVALILCLSMGSVVYAEQVNKAPSSEESTSADWSGLYVGLNGGYGWGIAKEAFSVGGNGSSDDECDNVNLFADYDTGGSFRQGIDGGILGGHLGFNKQLSSFVFGLEASLEGSFMDKTSKNKFNLFLDPTPTTTYKTSVEWFSTITPRFGYALGSWLVYAKGGLSAARLKSKQKSSQTQDGQELSFKRKQDYIGWTVGAGIEYLWRSHWIFGVEYDYNQFGKRNYGGLSSPNTTWPVQYTITPDFNTVLLRLSYKI